MAAVTYFVRMTAKEGLADEVHQTLLINCGNVQKEAGNIVFAVHRSNNPNEFWIYETWETQTAVDAHESSERFAAYKTKLRPMVDGDTVLFGNATPLAVQGYAVEVGG